MQILFIFLYFLLKETQVTFTQQNPSFLFVLVFEKTINDVLSASKPPEPSSNEPGQINTKKNKSKTNNEKKELKEVKDKFREWQRSFENACIYVTIFRGIPKFTGLVSSDEDEVSASTDNHESFLYKNFSMEKDACGFVRTDKSNGENCKLSVICLNGIDSSQNEIYAMAGSKNTCVIWPFYHKNIYKIYPEMKLKTPRDQRIPVKCIVKLYAEWIENKDKTNRKWLRDVFINHMGGHGSLTLMGEMNSPMSEHIIPIPLETMFIELYAIINNGTREGLPISVHKSIDLFKLFQMDRPSKALTGSILPKGSIVSVNMNDHDIKEMDTVILKIRDDSRIEGSVLYIYNRNKDVIGLFKVKSTDYVVRRRLRERMKNAFWNLLARGEIKGYTSSRTKKKKGSTALGRYTIEERREHLRGHLAKGMRQLTHVPGYRKKWTEWADFSIGFMLWWVETRLLADKDVPNVSNVSHVDQILNEIDCRYASMLNEYIQDVWSKKSS